MREFSLDDAFTVSEILDKMGVTDELTQLMADASGKSADEAKAVGASLVLLLVRKIYKAKAEVVKLVSDLTGDNADDVKKYNIAKIKGVLTEIFDSGVKDFFGSAGASGESE